MSTPQKNKCKASLVSLALAGMIGASSAAAQSLYGCSSLENARIPSFEGQDGSFFQIDPDLLNYNRIPEAMVAELAQLSEALDERGTRLIYLALPTKSLSMRKSIGPEAVKFGFSYDLAAAIYDDAIERLAAAHVTAPNIRETLAALADESSHFDADPRLSQAGTRALATAIATDIGASGEDTFELKSGEITILESIERQYLQSNCQGPLPQPVVETLEVVKLQSAREPSHAILVGSRLAVDPSLSFSEFLQDDLGIEVSSISSEESIDAVAAYLTSDGFRSDPPDYLIWASPIWQNPMQRGDRPMRELIAAAKGRCEVLEATRLENGSAQLSLERDKLRDFTLLAEFPRPEMQAEFRFSLREDTSRERQIVRVIPGNRFYMPLTGLWSSGDVSVEVSSPSGSVPRLNLCEG